MGTPLLRPPLLSAGPARKLYLLLLGGQELFKVMEDQTPKQLLPGADPAGALAPGVAAPPPVPLPGLPPGQGLWEAEQLDMSEALLTVLSALCSLPPERLPSRGPAARRQEARVDLIVLGLSPCRTVMASWLGTPLWKVPSTHRVTFVGRQHQGQAVGI